MYLEVWALADLFEYKDGVILVRAGYTVAYDVLKRHKRIITEIVRMYDPTIKTVKVELNIND